MTILKLQGLPPENLSLALVAFESQFHYPLGPGRSFRIAHSEDYPRFFRAVGEGVTFVAVQKGRVLGTVGVAMRQLLMPDGTDRLVSYIGDLKIAEEDRGRRVLWRLIGAVKAWVRERQEVDAAFGVAMDGTSQTPPSYTGRVGLPSFEPLSKVMIFRIATDAATLKMDENRFTTMSEAGSECYRRLSRGRYACPAGQPAVRSEMLPMWLMSPDGSACGLLEDTRKAKRLIAENGSELLSAHLSCFAFESPNPGAQLIQVALRHCVRRRFPALFVAVANSDVKGLQQALGQIAAVVAPATIYGAGFVPGSIWNINSSEI